MLSRLTLAVLPGTVECGIRIGSGCSAGPTKLMWVRAERHHLSPIAGYRIGGYIRNRRQWCVERLLHAGKPRASERTHPAQALSGHSLVTPASPYSHASAFPIPAYDRAKLL